jgi:tripartite-type tricarboxylate transporter receptor subunit TctC
MNLQRLILTLSAIGVTIAASIQIASGQGYPSRAVTIIVPYPAGGPTDTTARILADRMKTSLGHPVIVENVSGAGGTIGLNRVARAPADGYTAVLGDWTSNVSSAALFPTQYDVLRDFEPVAMLTSSPQLFCRQDRYAGQQSARTGRMVEGKS